MNLVTSSAITMSSREIAGLVGKEHKHVLRDIRVMIDELEKDGPVLGHLEYKDSRQYTSKFDLNRELTETLITGYSIKLRHNVIVRLHELERILDDSMSALESRKVARLEAPQMTEAIKRDRETAGKDIRPHHFSNEFDLVNRIALGMTAKKFRAEHDLDKADSIRDHLSNLEIKCVEHLQRLNTSTNEINMPYESRKQHLNKVYLLRHKRGLIAEVLRIEQ